MRIHRFFSSLVAIGLVAATLSSCASDETAVQSTPTPDTSFRAEQTPFEYYRSPERQAVIQSALTEVGNDWMARMLTGEIPSTELGWAAGSAAPLNGYGILASAADQVDGQLYIQLSVNFVNGEIDLDAPVGLYANTASDHTLSMAGEGPIVESNTDSSGIKVPGSPCAYYWYYEAGLDEGDIRPMLLVNIDNTELPYGQALNPNTDYKVVGGETGEPSVKEIKHLDDMFIRELRALDVSSSNWE